MAGAASAAEERLEDGQPLLVPPMDATLRQTWLQLPPTPPPQTPEERSWASLLPGLRAERLGRWAAAATVYRAVLDQPEVSEQTRAEAAFGLARMLVTENPGEATVALARIPAELVGSLAEQVMRARILLMQGEREAARSWLKSALDPFAFTQPFHYAVAADDAALLASDGKEEERAALLRVLAGLRVDSGGVRVALALRRCNPSLDLRPGDRAVVDLAFDGLGEAVAATAVWASRPGPMAGWLAERALLSTAEPGAILSSSRARRYRVQLGCAAVDRVPARPPAAVVVGWVQGQLEPATLAAVHERVRAAAPRSPKELLDLTPEESPLRLPTLLSLASGRPEAVDEILALLDRLRAPAGVRLAAMRQLVGVEALSRERFCATADVIAVPEPASDAETLLARASMLQECDRGAEARRLLEAGLAAQPPSSLAAARIGGALLAQTERVDARRAIADRIGLPATDCSRAAPLVALPVALSADDYPPRLRWLGIESRQETEIAIGADGRATGARIVASHPPFLFDTATIGLVTRQPLVAAPRGGPPVACSGYRRAVAWRLPPDGADAPSPSPVPPSAPPAGEDGGGER
jgi:hypothetical protein